jgi:hypothetical protein
MPNERRIAEYTGALEGVFGRPLTSRDSVLESRLRRAESRLRLPLPPAIREFYGLAGAARETREHNVLFHPEDLVIEEDHLLFMEENQAVVHWGIPLSQKRRADPDVWQRVNGDEARWYPEEMTFATFILKNLAWQRGAELSNKRMQLTRSAMAKGRRGPRS